MERLNIYVRIVGDLKYAPIIEGKRDVENATVVVFVSINGRGIYAKTATGKEYVFMEDKDGFVRIVEGLKYVNTTDRRRTVEKTLGYITQVSVT